MFLARPPPFYTRGVRLTVGPKKGQSALIEIKKTAFVYDVPTSLYSSSTTTATTALVTLYTARNRLVARSICISMIFCLIECPTGIVNGNFKAKYPSITLYRAVTYLLYRAVTQVKNLARPCSFLQYNLRTLTYVKGRSTRRLRA